MTSPSRSYGELDDALAEFVGRKVAALQNRYRARDGDALAAMARLRRGVGQLPGQEPRLWALTLEDFPAVLDRLKKTDEERNGIATVWERAAFDAITLHALHQQSQSAPMHQRTDSSLGAAAKVLRSQTQSETVRARFNSLATISGRDARLVHMRGLISQLRAAAISMDYARFAVDLRRLDDQERRDGVLLGWARDYHRNTKPDADGISDEETTGEPQ
ncbi:type I-E CRISPR-associated protein Cse2/CasB [Nocardia thailandica]|uniref:Type I-E CRISPR-associated protein Cse2/CasB n=1 Tax=Nocardia thailandica TaxID=257275 RepID=A0ABW6PHX2_9NOCA